VSGETAERLAEITKLFEAKSDRLAKAS